MAANGNLGIVTMPSCLGLMIIESQALIPLSNQEFGIRTSRSETLSRGVCCRLCIDWALVIGGLSDDGHHELHSWANRQEIDYDALYYGAIIYTALLLLIYLCGY